MDHFSARRLGGLRPQAALALLAFLLALPACATPEARPLAPLVAGWQQFFEVRAEVETRGGQPVVAGHIRNAWGVGARDVRLLVEGLDAGGRVLSREVVWLGTDLMPGVGVSFAVPVRQPAVSYRVSVFAFDWIEGRGAGVVRPRTVGSA